MLEMSVIFIRNPLPWLSSDYFLNFFHLHLRDLGSYCSFSNFEYGLHFLWDWNSRLKVIVVFSFSLCELKLEKFFPLGHILHIVCFNLESQYVLPLLRKMTARLSCYTST